ncbi:MAG: head-tail connector protein [Gemmatimonadota bacterium]|nr:MAG: head-tail connector protein [Gemmatimonadota bacterium]
MPNAKDLTRRYEQLANERKTFEANWQEIADHELGRRDFITMRTAGEQRMQRIYDDTAKVSGGLLAGAMHSLLTNPATKWFELKFEDNRLNQIPTAALWLHFAEKQLYNAFNRPEAGFHAQLAENYIDLVYFGTSCLFVEDVAGSGVRFSARPLAEMYLAENAAGRIDTVFRKFRLTARQAVELFGVRAKRAQKDMNSNRPDDRRDYLHVIVPNGDRTVGRIDVAGMAWASFMVAFEENEILSAGGYREFPLAIPRWQKDAGETYGRGPGWDALSDQKMVNEMKRVSLKAGQKAVDPPLLVDSEGVLPSQLRVRPGGIIPINAVMSQLNPPVQALESKTRFDISVTLIEDTRQQVKEAFHHQLIEMIRDPRMTATQVLELSAQMQRHLAPILGRMQTEMLEPTIERVFAIEARAGRLPAIPLELQGQPLKIEYVSPVARAQKASDARAIIDLFNIGSGLVQIEPGVLDVLNMDAGIRELADALGVPPTVIRSVEQVEARRQAMAQLAEERDAERQTQIAADVAQKVVPLVQSGAPGAAS